MIIHLLREIRGKHYTHSSSWCGRLDSLCDDGMNVTDKNEEVTCLFCLGIMHRREIFTLKEYLDRKQKIRNSRLPSNRRKKK